MTPALEFVTKLTVELSKPHEMGACASGTRRIIPIVGGKAEGPRLNGKVLNVGADWQTVSANGVAKLDARYGIETDDGAIIEVVSQGVRDASPEVTQRIAAGEQVPVDEYYMRTVIRLDCSHPDYDWVNRALFVSAGGKVGAQVLLDVYHVL